jgi:sugar phosphate isomerase/epimerase
MLLGYNTNGLVHHRLLDAIDLLASEGYQSVAITLDAGALDPYTEPALLARQIRDVRDRLDRHGLRRVVETGARYLLNPFKKHDPTLLDPDPKRRGMRLDFLRRAVEVAEAIEAEAVSFWSGALPDATSDEVAMERLVGGIQGLLAHAEMRDAMLAFEPEPGMFIDTFERFRALDKRIRHPLFELTVDIGHVHCIEEGDAADHLRSWAPRIRNIHIEDMKRGIHEHLMFGEGTVEFADVIDALKSAGYSGGLHVELSRHSHMGAEAVRRAREFLLPLIKSAPRGKVGV